MGIAVQIALVLAVLLGLGVWAVVSGLRAVQRERGAGITPQELTKLAQPYRRYLGEAAALQRDVAAQVRMAPKPLRRELNEIVSRISRLISRAYPRALQGTRILEQVNSLDREDPTQERLKEASEAIEAELKAFLETLKVLRGKVYRVLADATALDKDAQLSRDLEDALLEVQALEEVFRNEAPLPR